MVRVPAQHQERERLVPEVRFTSLISTALHHHPTQEEVEGLEHSLHGMQIGGGGGI